jgi:hypothetical protein
MADASEIRHAEELLRHFLIEWRDAGGSVESVTGAILRLIVARERFAAAGGWALAAPPQETRTGPACPVCGKSDPCIHEGNL